MGVLTETRRQGENRLSLGEQLWWATLPEPRGSEPGFRRPVLVIQADSFLNYIEPLTGRILQLRKAGRKRKQ